ncbi:MAG TPA: hypothetical protein VN824_20370 [Puia sp.]|nr:hypothetical protein [Puia sp.]
MKKIALFTVALLGIIIISCNKENYLAPYAPPVKNNFSVSKFAHIKDTILVGDTLNIKASGTVTDTTKTLSVFLTAAYGTVTYNVGSVASPIKVNRVIGAAANGAYAWTANIPVLVTSGVPHNSKVTVSGTFSYQLSLSSVQPSAVTFSDQGLRPGDKTNLTTVFVK